MWWDDRFHKGPSRNPDSQPKREMHRPGADLAREGQSPSEEEIRKMRHVAKEQPRKSREVTCSKGILGNGQMVRQFIVKGRRNCGPEPSNRPHDAHHKPTDQRRQGRFEKLPIRG